MEWDRIISITLQPLEETPNLISLKMDGMILIILDLKKKKKIIKSLLGIGMLTFIETEA